MTNIINKETAVSISLVIILAGVCIWAGTVTERTRVAMDAIPQIQNDIGEMKIGIAEIRTELYAKEVSMSRQ